MKSVFGKLYTWNGSDYTDTSGTTKYIVKGTGDVAEDGTLPTWGSSTGWFVSDDLDQFNASRAMVRVKATKTAGATTSLHTLFGCRAVGMSEANEFGFGKGESGKGASILISSQASTWTSAICDISNGSEVPMLQMGNGGNGYMYFKFSADGSGFTQPFTMIACYFIIIASASISGHTYQFQVQWIYS